MFLYIAHDVPAEFSPFLRPLIELFPKRCFIQDLVPLVNLSHRFSYLCSSNIIEGLPVDCLNVLWFDLEHGLSGCTHTVLIQHIEDIAFRNERIIFILVL
jgi:hypothetical protein